MIKTITFACVHFAVAFTVAYVLTGSLAVGCYFSWQDT